MKASELLDIQNGTESTSKNTMLIERQPIPNTPFTMVKHEDKYFATMGMYRITPEQENEQDVEDYINENLWNIVLMIAGIVSDFNNNQKQ